jgi:hypothetical protein
VRKAPPLARNKFGGNRALLRHQTKEDGGLGTARRTSSWRFVRFDADILVNVTRLVVVKSALCCSTKLVEDTSQESSAPTAELLIFKIGAESNLTGPNAG